MKPRFRTLFLLAFVLALALPGATLADDGAPPQARPQPSLRYSPPPPDVAVEPSESSESFSRPVRALAGLTEPDATNVQLGQPGTSFRYVQTYGETETAYLEDSNHFYDAEGIFVDGNNLWVTDSWGSRVVKFNNSGGFLQKIGKAGFRDSSGASLDYLTDVAVDAGGNIWVVDGGANHVVKYDSAGNRLSELGQAWSSGSDNSRFDSPISIAFDAAGNIYVSDTGLWGDYGNQRVQVFDNTGNYLATIGQTGVVGPDNGHFRWPRHIAVFGTQLYVADAGNQRVQVFNISNPAAPTYVATLGVTGATGGDNGHFDSPEGVGVDANFIYVADSNNQRVQIFNRSTRAYVATIGAGSYGTDNNHFNHPTDVAIDAAGNIYVADSWNKRVQQFSPGRVYQRTYGTTGVSYATDAYHYYFPNGVAVGKDGSTYIVEGRGHRLVKLDANGVAQWTVGQPGQGGDDTEHLCWLQDVAIDAQGRVYVAQNGCDTRVRVFNPDGSLYAYVATGWGAANDQLNGPQGLAIDKDDNIFVADSGNHRVQIFDPNRAYVATLGQTEVAGSDNSHFNYPTDVAVDGNGTIYVTDEGNDRVQVFNRNREYVRTLGGGETGRDFGHFEGWGPQRLAVDAQDRLYVADSGNHRVQVFDVTGAYLTTIGGSWGAGTGQMRGPHGLAIGPDGALYVADYDNDRVQKFALGVPGWKQVNINGFGAPSYSDVLTLTPFAGQLYAGGCDPDGIHLRRMDANGAWTAAPSQFGDATVQCVDDLAQFSGRLYAGTYNYDTVANTSNGAQVWRSVDGAAWERVASAGFGDPTNGDVFRMAVFGGSIYAVTDSFTDTHSSEIWRSPSGDANSWQRVVDNAFDDADNWISAFEAGVTHLYAGTWNDADGAQVWRSSDGALWTQVNANGFDGVNTGVISFAEFHGQLYAGTRSWTTGAQIWRCSTCDTPGSWSQVVGDGFGDGNNGHIRDLYVHADQLYATTYNDATGLEVWRTSDGLSWAKVGAAGLGDSNNRGTYFDRALAAFNSRLYLGTQNYPNGAEIWVQSLTADFTAMPTRGQPPLTVQFTNTSVGDYTTSQWDFGDGATSDETNPNHTYQQTGTYTVKLTVGDGTDSDTVTREAAVRVGFDVFLPSVMRVGDPWLYDDFNDPTWDGAWNPAKWSPDQTATVYRQQSGTLVVTEPPSANPTGGTLRAVSPHYRSWQKAQLIEARLKISSDRTGGRSPIGIALVGEGVNGHTWSAVCQLGASGDTSQGSFFCWIMIRQGDNYITEYGTASMACDYNTWCIARIETDPVTGNVKFYLNNTLIGSHTPNDAAALVASDQVQVTITNWGVDANSTATRYVDDVRITPAK